MTWAKLGSLLVPAALGAGAHSGVFGLTVSGTMLLHLSAMVDVYRPEPIPPPEPEPEPRDRLTIDVVELTRAQEEEEEPEQQEVVDAIPPPPAAWTPAPAASEPVPEALQPSSDRLAGGERGDRPLPSFDRLIAPIEDDRARDASVALGRAFREDTAILAMLGTGSEDGQLAAVLGDSALGTTRALGSGSYVDTLAIGVGGGSGLAGGGSAGIGGLGRMVDHANRDELDQAALRRAYISRIGRAVRRVRDYPIAAQDDGLEGTVVLQITIGSAGEIRAVVVARSSGHSILDDAAVASVKKLGSLPAPPAELEWDEQTVRVSIVYSLDLP